MEADWGFQLELSRDSVGEAIQQRLKGRWLAPGTIYTGFDDTFYCNTDPESPGPLAWLLSDADADSDTIGYFTACDWNHDLEHREHIQFHECCGEWLRVTLQLKNGPLTGWLPAKWFCSNPHTNCHRGVGTTYVD